MKREEQEEREGKGGENEKKKNEEERGGGREGRMNIKLIEKVEDFFRLKMVLNNTHK